VRLAKQYSGFYFSKAFHEHIWQRYGRDQIVREGDDVRRIARYIIENPVEAGLVKKPQEYPFTGSHIYSREDLIRWAYS
jgi:hypothetical protein